MSNPYEVITVVAAVIVGVISSGRLTRLLVHDSYPPVEWLRLQWVRLVRGNEDWAVLVECHWCAAPWIVAPNLAWAVLSETHWSWWLFNGWLAASYAASWIVHHDEDE